MKLTVKNVSIEELGISPYLIHQAEEVSDVNSFIKNLESIYGYPLIELGGKIIEEGVYESEYASDEKLDYLAHYPIPEFEMDVYQYNYGIVAFVMEDFQFITRMD